MAKHQAEQGLQNFLRRKEGGSFSKFNGGQEASTKQQSAITDQEVNSGQSIGRDQSRIIPKSAGREPWQSAPLQQTPKGQDQKHQNSHQRILENPPVPDRMKSRFQAAERARIQMKPMSFAVLAPPRLQLWVDEPEEPRVDQRIPVPSSGLLPERVASSSLDSLDGVDRIAERGMFDTQSEQFDETTTMSIDDVFTDQLQVLHADEEYSELKQANNHNGSIGFGEDEGQSSEFEEERGNGGVHDDCQSDEPMTGQTGVKSSDFVPEEQQEAYAAYHKSRSGAKGEGALANMMRATSTRASSSTPSSPDLQTPFTRNRNQRHSSLNGYAEAEVATISRTQPTLATHRQSPLKLKHSDSQHQADDHIPGYRSRTSDMAAQHDSNALQEETVSPVVMAQHYRHQIVDSSYAGHDRRYTEARVVPLYDKVHVTQVQTASDRLQTSNGDITVRDGEKKRRECSMELDYDNAQLENMSFDKLRTESFDYNPRAAAGTSHADLTLDDLTKKLKELASLRNLSDADLSKEQQAFFSALTINQYQDCGDIIVKQFSEILHKFSNVRQQKRKAAGEFEEEIFRREEAVSVRTGVIAKDLHRLKKAGQDVVGGRGAQ